MIEVCEVDIEQLANCATLTASLAGDAAAAGRQAQEVAGSLHLYAEDPGLSPVGLRLRLEAVAAELRGQGRDLGDHGIVMDGVATATKNADLLDGVPVDSQLAAAIIAGEIAPPDDTIRDQVAWAMSHGKTAQDVGLDPRYFPPEYQAILPQLRRNNTERMAIDEQLQEVGSPYSGRKQERRELNAARNSNRDERAQLLATVGLDGEDDELTLIALTGSHLGRSWQGRALAEWYEPHRVDTEFGEQLNDSVDVAVSFFNEVGVQELAAMPTLIELRWGNATEIVVQFSDALGVASRSGELAFTGAELVEAGLRPHGVEYTSPLFYSGDFDPDFLVSATAAHLRAYDEANHLDVYGDWGESGTNIMLNRINETPELAAIVVEELGVDGARHYLSPGQGFEADSTFRDRNDTTIATFPIATFIVSAAANDPDVAAIILQGAAGVEEFSDTGVAAGVDGVMAMHAAIMYDGAYLAARGIAPNADRIDQQDWFDLGMDDEDWRRIRGHVLEYGQGGLLVEGNNVLIGEVIADDLLDGNLGGDADRYDLMVTNGAVLEEQWFQRVLEIRKDMDDRAVRDNGYLNAAVSGGVTVAAIWAPPAAAVGGSLFTTGALAIRPIEYWDTDNAVRLLEEQRVKDAERLVWTGAVIHQIVSQAAASDNPIKTTTGYELSIETIDGVEVLVKTDPETGERTENPTINWNNDGRVGDQLADLEYIIARVRERVLSGEGPVEPSPWITTPRSDAAN